MMPKVDIQSANASILSKCKSFGTWHVLLGRMECDIARACVINGTVRTETSPEQHTESRSQCIMHTHLKKELNENQHKDLQLQSSVSPAVQSTARLMMFRFQMRHRVQGNDLNQNVTHRSEQAGPVSLD